MYRKLFTSISLFLLTTTLCAVSSPVPLEKVSIDRYNQASMQRGSKYFMQYCSGCHSLKYVRYADMAKDLGIVYDNGQPHKEFILKYLNFINDDPNSSIKKAMSDDDGQLWFGKTPPDLSLVIRSRGANWVYTYLKTFYPDSSRPLGVNNVVYPNVGMPHVLEVLQPPVEAVFDTSGHVTGVRYKSSVDSTEVLAYDKVIDDIVHFLDYISEPKKKKRLEIGFYVLLSLVIFSLFSYLNYKELWKSVH
jgi:ubiquinol-cytochrome c reductase cytochrome c1 subunit